MRELFKKTSATRRLANGPPWNDVDFDRELQWAMNWFPGKSGVIEYVVQETGDSNAAFEAQEEKIESEECEPGSGIDCGCCFSEYVAVGYPHPAFTTITYVCTGYDDTVP